MEESNEKVRINPRAFVQDFVQGTSSDELAEKYGVSAAQLDRLLEVLLQRGYLSPEQISQNKGLHASAGMGVHVDRTPFAVLRARSILLCALLAGVAAIFWSIFIAVAFLGWESEALGGVIFDVLLYGFFILLLRRRLSRAGLELTVLSGPQPDWSVAGRYLLLAFPLWFVGVASLYLIYFPLSYVMPGFVTWVIVDASPILCTSDSMLTNLGNFLRIVFLAPVLEEFVFRGLLLTRWSLKWNVRRGIFLSSLVFGLGHPDFIGAFFVGYVLSMVYIQTKSLYVPIAIHALHNGISWIIEAISILAGETDAKATLAEWQSYWWVGLLAGIVVLPWVILFIKRHWPAADWSVPYLSLRETARKTA